MSSYFKLFSEKNALTRVLKNKTKKLFKRNINKIITQKQFDTKMNESRNYLKQKQMDQTKANEICNKIKTTNCDEQCIQYIADCPIHHIKLKKIAELYNTENSTEKINVNDFSNLDLMNLRPEEEDTYIKVAIWFDSYVNNININIPKNNGGKKKTKRYRRKSVYRS
jgi:Flp pilus assembly CpaF family ATPase